MLIPLALEIRPSPAFGGENKPMSLEETFRGWHKGFSSGKKEDWEKTFHSMYPTKKDLEYLFPRHAEKMWPVLEQDFQEKLKGLLKNGDKEITANGAIKKIQPIDVRKDENARKRFAGALATIPKQVPVFQLAVEYERGTRTFADATACLRVQGRWFCIPEFAEFSPQMLEKLDLMK
jgi:hypothetical protein